MKEARETGEPGGGCHDTSGKDESREGRKGKEGKKRMREQTKSERTCKCKKEKEREGGCRMHRERWQFIGVPRIVDTYYHAKYNMLTTSHNVGPRSSRFSPRTTVRRIAFPRPENFIADGSADATRLATILVPKATRFSSRSQSPRLLETRTSSGTYQEESLTYDSLFMYSSFLMQNSDVEDL